MEEQTNEVKKSRGGARSGAGRKRKENSRTNKVAVSLSDKAFENLQRLVKINGTNKNDVLNNLLEDLF